MYFRVAGANARHEGHEKLSPTHVEKVRKYRGGGLVNKKDRIVKRSYERTWRRRWNTGDIKFGTDNFAAPCAQHILILMHSFVDSSYCFLPRRSPRSARFARSNSFLSFFFFSRFFFPPGKRCRRSLPLICLLYRQL